jgi:hypothetical protein
MEQFVLGIFQEELSKVGTITVTSSEEYNRTRAVLEYSALSIGNRMLICSFLRI